MNNYRFNEEINEQTGKKNHLHQILRLDTGEWSNLTGTSGVMDVLAKPLTWWASGLAVSTLGWTKAEDWRKLKTDALKEADLERRIKFTTPAFEMIKGMSIQDYIELLDQAYKAHSVKLDKSADAGTDLHEILEHYVKGHMQGKEIIEDKKIKPFVEWTKKNVKRFIGSETHCYSGTLWIGGITDAVAELKNGEIAIIDFKSAKDAYDSHFFQIAGYDLQIIENGGFDAKGNQIFKLEKPITQHIVVPFGAKEPYPVVSRLVEDNKEAFRSALTLYRIKSKLSKE